jgi:hypothetical protein
MDNKKTMKISVLEMGTKNDEVLQTFFFLFTILIEIENGIKKKITFQVPLWNFSHKIMIKLRYYNSKISIGGMLPEFPFPFYHKGNYTGYFNDSWIKLSSESSLYEIAAICRRDFLIGKFIETELAWGNMNLVESSRKEWNDRQENPKCLLGYYRKMLVNHCLKKRLSEIKIRREIKADIFDFLV